MALLSLCHLLHPDMGKWSSAEADSDLAHGVEIEAPSEDGDLDELLLAALQQFEQSELGSKQNQVESKGPPPK